MRKKKIAALIDPSLYEWLEQRAAKEVRDISGLVRFLLEKAREQETKKESGK